MQMEWLILADSAQVVGGKLYLLGGGWDRITVNNQFPVQQRMAVALSVKVPWNETNQKRTFEVEILSENRDTDELKSLMKAAGQFELGRPPGVGPGQDQRFQLALDITLGIEAAGRKIVVARIEGLEIGRTEFVVISGAAPPRNLA